MSAALLAVASAQLALFVLVCGAILWELRRARLEARDRGHAMFGEVRGLEEFQVLLDQEIRRVKTGVRGDGT